MSVDELINTLRVRVTIAEEKHPEDIHFTSRQIAMALLEETLEFFIAYKDDDSKAMQGEVIDIAVVAVRILRGDYAEAKEQLPNYLYEALWEGLSIVENTIIDISKEDNFKQILARLMYRVIQLSVTINTDSGYDYEVFKLQVNILIIYCLAIYLRIEHDA